jgi:hypothetical protein
MIKHHNTPTHKRPANRSIDLSANFADDYAAGWFMAVHSCFRSSLDIELTPRMKKDPETGKNREEMVWTQGTPPIYNFACGDILYDAKKVYGRTWGDTLADISVLLQVVEAAPDEPDSLKSKVAGFVVAREYRPRSDQSGVDFVKTHRMTQDEFVATLKTGLLPDGKRL